MKKRIKPKSVRSTTMKTQSRTHTMAERGHDMYPTPPQAVQALMSHVDLPHHIWEPCAGAGHISKVLKAHGRTVWSTDLRRYGYPLDEEPADYLTIRQANFCAEAIVTNPPYSLAAEFIEHSMFHAPLVCMLMRLAFLEGGSVPGAKARASSVRRTRILDSSGLRLVLPFRNRLPMMHRRGWKGNKAGSAVPFAWFVWERGYKDAPTIQRISWVPEK